MTANTLALTDALAAYLVAHSARETQAQRALRRLTQRLPDANMQTAPEQGALLQVLVRLIGARRCLEIGTFTGYSALCVALALPRNGRLVCCDVNEEWAAIARRHWQKAGIARKIDLRLASALETLDALLKGGQAGRFDFAFIDADKKNYGNYFERCLRLVRKGGLVAIDNTLWYGRVIDCRRNDEDTRAIRSFNRKLHRDPRIHLAMVPIGDGLTLALKR